MEALEPTTPAQVTTRKSKPFLVSWKVAFLVIVAAFIALNAGCQALLHSSGGHPSSSTALIACHDAVKAQLNNTATADFQTFSTTITEEEITGVLRAENSFGVPSEITYVCTRSGSSITAAHLLSS